MTKSEVIQLISYLASNNYREINEKTSEQKEIMVNSWLDCLQEFEYDVVMKAIKELMQRSVFMPKLSEIIELSKEYKQAVIDNTPKLSAGVCSRCKNKGFILYTKKIGKLEYKYAARCSCTQGNKYMYDGRLKKDERHRSNYYIPTLEQLGM